MKKCKVILSWILTVCMIASLMTGFHTASAAAPAIDSIVSWDDASIVAGDFVPVSDTTYEVKIPDGRPRIPQLTAVNGTVTQAFMADDAAQADATVVVGDKTYSIVFKKDAGKGFVLQYDDYYVWNSGIAGASYSSSNTSVATVNASTGEIHILKAGETVTITATGATTKSLEVKTIKAVMGVWMLTGQSNSAWNYNLQDMNDNKITDSLAPKKGTALHYGASTTNTIGNGSLANQNNTWANDVHPMTNASTGKATIGGTESGIAKSVYEKTGEKVFIMNAGISGTGIGNFVPGANSSFSGSSGTWSLIQYVYERAHALMNKPEQQANYEFRMRSFFFLQGCAEVGSHWTTHYNGFAVTKNSNSFTTLGTTYPSGSHTFLTYMTEVLGFDYALDIMVGYRPVGIVTSTRTAQFNLAKDFDNYFVVTRLGQTTSQKEGTFRYDELHFSQYGKDVIGEHAGANAARIYSGKKVLEPATGATAYFEQIPFADGETLYVTAGDFYNYATRPSSLSSDDTFAYKFVGDNIITYDGENDFIVNADAKAGQSADMQIYSVANASTPISTIHIKVIGEGSNDIVSTDSEHYRWTFNNNQPTTVAGNIDLKDGGLGTTAKELTKDITLDSDGYWSIEWKSDKVGNGSMLLSSADKYSKSTLGDDIPNFMFVYHTNDTGWRVFRDTVYTDNFWRAQTGSAIATEHVYKLECRNNVYTFSIDGVVQDSRKIVPGHASYPAGYSYSGAGKFSNEFNVHYLLGGLNQNGLSSTKYGYDGNVSYIDIKIGKENPAITEVNGVAVTAPTGKGTYKDPYVVYSEIDFGVTIKPSMFKVSSPAGTVALATDDFGGPTLNNYTAKAGENAVYATILGALPHMSTFYKVIFVAPDPTNNEVMVDPNVAVADGTAVNYNVGGRDREFIMGKNLFTGIPAALAAVNTAGTVYVQPGVYSDNVTVAKNVTVKGAQAGVKPDEVISETQWEMVRDTNTADETVLAGKWTVAATCNALTVDGVYFTDAATFTAERATAGSKAFGVTFLNTVFRDMTELYPLVFDAPGAFTMRDCTVEDNAGMLDITATATSISSTYFGTLEAVGTFAPSDIGAAAVSFSFANNMVGDIVNNPAIELCYGGKLADGGDYVQTFNISGNTFGNAYAGAFASNNAADNGVINFRTDMSTFNFAMDKNLFIGKVNSADSAVLNVGSVEENADYGDRNTCYIISKNRLVIAGSNLPMLVTSNSTAKVNHNNIDVSGNYAELGGTVMEPVTDTTANEFTGGSPISFLDYYYTTPDMTEATCDHVAGVWVVGTPANCTEAGVEVQLCVRCQAEVNSRPIQKLGHDAGKWGTLQDVSCTQDGIRVKCCTRCDFELDREVTDKKAHSYKLVNTVEPTCSAVGKHEYACKVCNEPKVETIAQLLHTTGEWKVVTPADCENDIDGLKELYCTECELLMASESIPAEHTPVWGKPDKYGIREQTCTTCGTVLDVEFVSNYDITDEYYDIGLNDWFVKNGSVELVTALGFFEGVAPGEFAPNANMTRAMFVTVLSRMAGIDVDNDVKTRFEDVESGKWYTGAIAWASEYGIVDGTSYYTFSPNAPITREQICKMVISFCDSYGVTLAKTTKKVTFKDADEISSWARAYVTECQRAGVIKGKGNNMFDPQGLATRAEVATIIMNLLMNPDFII